jgi:hypothetical protein
MKPDEEISPIPDDDELADAVHAAAIAHPPVDGAVLMGYVFVGEYRLPEGGDQLSKRSGDVHGDTLRSWREQGYLFSALHTDWAISDEDEGDE